MSNSMQRIGELNGPWAILFKIAQLSIPVMTLTIIPWGVWSTRTSYALETRITKLESWASIAPRFTTSDADALRLRILNDIDTKFASSNARVLEKLDAIQKELTDMKLEFTRHMSSTTKP